MPNSTRSVPKRKRSGTRSNRRNGARFCAGMPGSLPCRRPFATGWASGRKWTKICGTLRPELRSASGSTLTRTAATSCCLAGPATCPGSTGCTRTSTSDCLRTKR
uniref:(northern house mosquito) hypothetical protein n=1 Tax=Culex pipiens TaxID=7175 RepID=A0A8D8C682_CULPI